MNKIIKESEIMRNKFEKIMSDFNAEVSRILIKKNWNQTQIGKLINTTQPAVSQYLNNLRGNGYLDNKYKIMINELCNENHISKDKFRIELLKLCIKRYEELIEE